MNKLPRILWVVDEDTYISIAVSLSHQTLADYDHESLFQNWRREDPITNDTHGPLNSKFLIPFIAKNHEAYDIAIVDHTCIDLLSDLRKGGYSGPIIGIVYEPDPHADFSAASVETNNITDYFLGKPMQGADVVIGLSSQDFDERLKSSIESLLKQ